MKAIEALEKTCKACKRTKQISEFYKQQQHGKNGQIWKYYDQLCIDCRKAYSLVRRRNIKRMAVLYKGGKCASCGYNNINHLEVFDFHHVDSNVKELAIGSNTRSFERIKGELDKCNLLCANCHRIEHSNND